MTAVAVARYLLADAVRAQRVVLPVVLQVAVLAVLFGGDPGRLPEPWGASVLTLYPIAAWLALTVAHTEDPVQRDVTVAAAGGVGPVAAGTLLVALASDLGLAVLSVVWPVIVTPYPAPPSIVLTACWRISRPGRPVRRSGCCARGRGSGGRGVPCWSAPSS
ncbi:hypothetical protein LWC35_26830 [Pseudonocardia kujensis]|uniref:hypothetical protein n=1 Tax=Pseudonocardia kujensis TaxID=1128675 RepID=UPI001E427BD4|nr:hypothetical protein [Pseudonocardia kujensis]MCE0766493.1 hypothetical protein [Pseudonocardia kujensis]